MVDGWEDAAGRSLYGVVAAQVNEPPVILGLTNLTGKRATAETVVDVCKENAQQMGLELKNFSAVCTDNPSTMILARKKMEEEAPRLIVSVHAQHACNLM